MKTVWNKGHTKTTNSSVEKISATMRLRKIDNFKLWREEMKKIGKIKSSYPHLQKNGDLAELIGVILGDGHIGVFPRTESLRIVANSNNKGFVHRYARMVERVFKKQPHVAKRKKSFATNITIYEKEISKRLNVPSGSRAKKNLPMPPWIKNNRRYLIRFLRGLYEAEGSYNIHKATYTHKLIFSNTNESLLKNVLVAVSKLGFHPHYSKNKIQISRKEEVQKLKNLLEFRNYEK